MPMARPQTVWRARRSGPASKAWKTGTSGQMLKITAQVSGTPSARASEGLAESFSRPTPQESATPEGPLGRSALALGNASRDIGRQLPLVVEVVALDPGLALGGEEEGPLLLRDGRHISGP